MSLVGKRRGLASEFHMRPERDREFDAVVVATTGILLAIAFWMHLNDRKDDSQASSQVANEMVILDDGEHPGQADILQQHLVLP